MKQLLTSKKFWVIAGTTAVTVFTVIVVVKTVKARELLELEMEDACIDA